MVDLNHVMEFTSDCKLFAYVDDSGKLKIWDTETNQLKQEYVPNLHLISPITCLKWIELYGNKAGKITTKKKRQEIKLYLALGTNKGNVAIYSYANGKIERDLEGKGHSDAVTALFYVSERGLLYTCGADSKVIQWSLTDNSKPAQTILDCGKSKLTAIAILGNHIVTASKEIKVWDSETGTCVKKFTAHSGYTTILKTFTFNEKSYCISVAKTEHIISMWCLDDDTEHPVSSFIVDKSDIISISLCEADDQLRMAAVHRNGILHLYDCNLNKIKKTIKRKCVIKIVDDGQKNITEPISIVAATLDQGFNDILVGYGDRMLMRFEQINPDFSTVENILVRKNPKKFRKEIEHDNDRPHNVVEPIMEKGVVEYLNQVTSVKRDLKSTEIPLQTRLENVSISSDGPTPKNIARLLIQGLHSKDSTILRMVFQTNDEVTIKTTLNKLPPQYIKPLVDELSLLMQRKLVHVKCSVLWLKNLIQTHTGQLMALGTDNLKETFATVLGIMDHRLMDLPALMMLRGRVDLISNQFTIKKGNAGEEDIDTTQLLKYEDENDVNPDDLDLAESSDEEQNWDDESEAEEAESGEENMEIDSKIKNLTKSKSDDDEDDEEDDSESGSNEEMDVSE